MSQAIHPRRFYIGTTAERGAFSPPSEAIGAQWWDTDLSSTYWWDGSAWTGVSVLTSPDGGTDPVLSADNSGNVTLAGTGTLSIPASMVHSGDADTKFTFTDDAQEFTVGGLSMLKLTEAAQDLITLGPGSGDVDINFNGDMFLQGSDGFLGIGTIVPAALLDVQGIGTVASFGDGSGSAQIRFNGSVASRDMIFQSIGVNRWIFRVDSTAESGSDVGSDFRIISRTDAGAFKTTPFFIKRSNGRTGVGNVLSPLAQIHIDQSSTTAAIPTLYLDQADVSEEMIHFQSIIGTGNAIEAVGGKTLTTTHFIKVTLRGGFTRYMPVGTIA